MKKRINLILLFFAFALITFSCKKEPEYNREENLSKQKITDNSEYNQSFNNLAKIVSLAIGEEKGFREVIKRMALNKFDGDYDVLLSDIINESIEYKNNKSIKLVDLLNDYVQREKISNNNNYVQSLAIKYPKLQISVPVHIEDWEMDFLPTVVYIPFNTDEKRIDYLPGYNNGISKKVDAQNKPDVPVIVIGENERMSDSVNMKINPDSNHPTPGNFPTIIGWSIQGAQIQSGIRIQWDYTSSNGAIIGYHIYRKEANNNNFALIGNSYGIYNKTYNDNNVTPLAWYSYRVTAFNIYGESISSSIINVQAPDFPMGAVTFDAVLNSPSDLELRWERPANSYFDYASIKKRVINIDYDYHEIAQINPNIDYYIDHNLIKGKKVIYKCNLVSNLGVSNSKYDFVIVPYRDVSVPTKVYVKKITFDYDDINDIEGWFRGAPEFHFVVVAGRENNATDELGGNYFQFPDRHSYCNFDNKEIVSGGWLPVNWSEILTIKAKEYDGTPHVDVAISAKINTKNLNKTGFGGEIGASFTIKDIFGADDEDMGIARLRYYDPETTWISFSKHGLKAKISTHN